ncbi:hypothetical protein Acid7E03_07140 [Acidisoma sp. 7E03]
MLLSFCLSEHVGADPQQDETGLKFRRQRGQNEVLTICQPGRMRREDDLQAETTDALDLAAVDLERTATFREKLLLQLRRRFQVEDGGE